MKIKRRIPGLEGMKFEIELTPEELRAAYEEKQHECDVQDVINRLNEMAEKEIKENYGISVNDKAEYEQFVEKIATEMRKNIDNHGTGWFVALNVVLGEYRIALSKAES